MNNIIKVGMADLHAARDPIIITTLGLGSCVGIALYDTINKICGLAHIMLPSSLLAKNSSNYAKFADTGIELLIKNMLDLGANKNNIVAKLAGGAQMFSFERSSDIMRIGERNIIATTKKLEELKIPIVSADTGGKHGRTIELHSKDGRLFIRTIGYGFREI